MMTAKRWILCVCLGAFLAVLIGFAVIVASPQVQHDILYKKQVPEPLKTVDWLEATAPGLAYCDPSESLVIVYDRKNDSWLLQNDTAWNRSIDIAEWWWYRPICNNADSSSPEDTRYTPDIAIDGDMIGIDFLIGNFAREDCANANFTLATAVERLNTTTWIREEDLPPVPRPRCRSSILLMGIGAICG